MKPLWKTATVAGLLLAGALLSRCGSQGDGDDDNDSPTTSPSEWDGQSDWEDSAWQWEDE